MAQTHRSSSHPVVTPSSLSAFKPLFEGLEGVFRPKTYGRGLWPLGWLSLAALFLQKQQWMRGLPATPWFSGPH